MIRWLAGVGASSIAGAACTVTFYFLEQNGTHIPFHVATAITGLVMAAVSGIVRLIP
jgi:hypothetical protein